MDTYRILEARMNTSCAPVLSRAAGFGDNTLISHLSTGRRLLRDAVCIGTSDGQNEFHDERY